MSKFSKWLVWFCLGVASSLLLGLVLASPAYTSAGSRSVPQVLVETEFAADQVARDLEGLPVLAVDSTSTAIAPLHPMTVAQGEVPGQLRDRQLPDEDEPEKLLGQLPDRLPPIEDETPLQLRNRQPLNPLPSRQLPTRSEDPADQVAPPGLNVQPGDEPISPFMAIAMQRELDNLAGRFESALFAANSADQPTEVRVSEAGSLLTAAADPTTVSVAVESDLHPALIEARQLVHDWSGLLENQAYGEARDRWLTVRQSLWENFPIDQAFAQPEIRAMWLDRGSIVRARSREGLAEVFDRMQSAGINTVFFETVNSSYPIYPSRVAPTQNPLTRGWDPLRVAVELAHERSMELHAWMWVFAAGNQRHNAILNLPTGYLGPVLNAHPNWAAYDQDGNTIPRGQTKPFFDPANPQVRRYLLDLVDEIISNYDIDGLQLDYIRYPFQDPGAERTYGYGQAARRQFHRLTGVDPVELTPRVDPWLASAERENQQALWDQWNEFRIEKVSSFVEATSKLVRRKRPDILLSTAVFPILEHERLQKIQQDWNHWAKEGWVDWIVLMSYARDANRFEKLIEPWVLNADYGSTLIIPSIRLLDLSVPAMIDQMQALRDLPAPGYALFATDNLDTRIQTVLNRTQESDDRWIPQQAPYQTAAQRFQLLQREWNWLLANGQLFIQPRLAAPWIEQVNALGDRLNELANTQSTTAIADIQAQIQALQRDLGAGMRLETATTRDYRLEAWENRLQAISRFLVYGAARQS